MNKISIMFLYTAPHNSTVLLGAERVISSIVSGINKNKFKPIVVAIQNNIKPCPLTIETQNKKITTEIVYLKNKFDLKGIDKICSLLKKYNIDILHCNEYKSNILGLLANRKRKAKLITTAHGWVRSDLKVRFYEFLDSIWIRFFDKIAAVSESRKKELLAKGIPDRKIKVVENGIDLKEFQNEAISSGYKKKFNLESNAKIIGTIGRINSEKGHKYLLEAFSLILKKFPNLNLLIVGDGLLKDKLLTLSKKLGIGGKIFFAGYQKDIASILSIIDIFVLPSLREACSIALIEAMVARKAVIATEVGNAKEVITNGENGMLVKTRDAESIRQAIEAVLEKNLQFKLGKKAQETAMRRFNLENMVKKYENIYMDMVEK